MVPWRKKHYHPIIIKNDHRWSLFLLLLLTVPDQSSAEPEPSSHLCALNTLIWIYLHENEKIKQGPKVPAYVEIFTSDWSMCRGDQTGSDRCTPSPSLCSTASCQESLTARISDCKKIPKRSLQMKYPANFRCMLRAERSTSWKTATKFQLGASSQESVLEVGEEWKFLSLKWQAFRAATTTVPWCQRRQI